MAVKTEDKRRRILSAALDCFEERGFAATRMEDIARSAGVAKGTIYNYFKGKEELLHALAEGIAGVMHRNLENVTSSENEGLPLKDRLMKVVAPLTDGTPRSKRNLRVFRLVWAEGLRSPEIMHDLYARLFVPVFRNDGLLARMLEKEDVPDFVRNRPVVLVAPLIQSIFIHVLVGNELIGLAPRVHQRLLRLHPLEERTRGARPRRSPARRRRLTSGPQASFGVGRKAARLTQSKSPAAA